MNNHIAYLFDGSRAYCSACRLPTEAELKSKYPPCKLWWQYIFPKSQNCYQCNKVLVAGSEAIELFTREGNPWTNIIRNVAEKELNKNANS